MDEIRRVRSDRRLPILVGGTGLYLKALMEGLAPVPEIDPETREHAGALRDRLGDQAFHAALAELDPEMAARLNPGDTQRVIRAYEVMLQTGRSLAEWHGSSAGTSR